MSQQNYPQDGAGQTPHDGGNESFREARVFPYHTGETPESGAGAPAAGHQQTDPAAPAPGYDRQKQYGSGPSGAQQYAQPQQPQYGSQPQGYDAQQYGSQPQQQYGSQPQGYDAQQYGSQPQQQFGSQPQGYGSQQQGPPEAGTQGSPNAYGSQPGSGQDQPVPTILDPRTGEIHPVADLNQLHDTDALLIVVSGPDAGAQILLDTDVVTVGRSPNADIFLDDVTVSRKHAEFVRTPSGFTLRDTGSLNGTYVGRQLIDSIELQNGADVQIGKFRMIFQQRPRSS